MNHALVGRSTSSHRRVGRTGPREGGRAMGDFRDVIDDLRGIKCSIKLKKAGLLFAGLIVLAAWLNAPHNSTSPQPQTMPEKIRAAVATQYSCTPSLSDLRFTGSDSTGTGYFAGCGRWLYWVFIDRQGQIRVSRTVEWNGR